ncbi:MAG: HipA domain-containing protein [Mobilicoccus sp.]|nr:HipA domain-containing protein [Mobilicoccus sp.]
MRRSLTEEALTTENTPRQPLESDYLLGVRDDLRQGALRYRCPHDSDGSWRASPTDGIPRLTELGTLLALADKVVANDADLNELRLLVGAGSSLGGARPKAHVLLPDDRVGIAKFPATMHDEWNVMAWEKVALDLAAAAGITVPPNRLVPVTGKDVLIVERFDRRGDTRTPYISAMTLLEATDGDRATYLDIAEAVEEVSPHAVADLQSLWRRCIFDILINNTDNHLRNHGFLRDTAGWTLSPAFDLNPTPFSTPFATDIADPGDGGSIDAALAVADYFRLRPDDARDTLGHVRHTVAEWDRTAAAHGITPGERRRMSTAFTR